ncbi:DUF3341 domain-containing protein [Hyalangium minutum]|uniref:ABC-type Fe3+ transport system protein n=1 Tax=Hyalangium minutum TaxID=394096 RepID=A0A085WAQ9_9BACT|nr:DUF3341 domain-containing protein [Hyalangium minutum]KFE64772.1 ABC-type Fe3+ transport system protein [Hyalangium minutum]
MKRWVLGEFGSPERLLEVARALRERGFVRLDAHTPFPVEGLAEVLELKSSRLPALGLLAGLGGAAGAYLVQWFTQAVDWPLNVGGRPLHSAPAFIPITFETGVLSAAGAVFLGLFVVCGLPRVTHPVFELESFRSASVDGFWISVAVEESTPPETVAEVLRTLGASQVSQVEGEE